MTKHIRHTALGFLLAGTLMGGTAVAQSPTPPRPAGVGSQEPPAPPPTPTDYIIGPDDILTVTFWRDKDLSGDVVVRPDGKISLPLLNDVQAAGLTPLQLRDNLVQAAQRFLEDPNATVVVKQINSRRVYITGQVERAGPYPISGPTTVLQLLAMAGGLREFADGKNIVIMRNEGANSTNFSFNYKDVIKGKNLKQNIVLRPGDTVIVP